MEIITPLSSDHFSSEIHHTDDQLNEKENNPPHATVDSPSNDNNLNNDNRKDNHAENHNKEEDNEITVGRKSLRARRSTSSSVPIPIPSNRNNRKKSLPSSTKENDSSTAVDDKEKEEGSDVETEEKKKNKTFRINPVCNICEGLGTVELKSIDGLVACEGPCKRAFHIRCAKPKPRIKTIEYIEKTRKRKRTKKPATVSTSTSTPSLSMKTENNSSPVPISAPPSPVPPSVTLDGEETEDEILEPSSHTSTSSSSSSSSSIPPVHAASSVDSQESASMEIANNGKNEVVNTEKVEEKIAEKTIKLINVNGEEENDNSDEEEDHENYIYKEELKTEDIVEPNWQCEDCLSQSHVCDLCGVRGKDNDEVWRCIEDSCGRFYHSDCVFRQLCTRVKSRARNGKKVGPTLEEKALENTYSVSSPPPPFRCPAHLCLRCTEHEKAELLDNRNNKPKVYKKKERKVRRGLITCIRCPISVCDGNCTDDYEESHRIKRLAGWAMLCSRHAPYPNTGYDFWDFAILRPHENETKIFNVSSFAPDSGLFRPNDSNRLKYSPNIHYKLPLTLVEEGLKLLNRRVPPPFKRISTNLYLMFKKPSGAKNEDEAEICQCGELEKCGEGSHCWNRASYIECDRFCKWGDECQNKRLQRKEYAKSTIFDAKEKGWGLKAGEDIKAGQLIVEYVGEVIDSDTCIDRLQRNSELGIKDFYMFKVTNDMVLDAGPYGNNARFINHSCAPNCITQKWWVNGVQRVGIFAQHDIAKDEEFSYDYRCDVFNAPGTDPVRCYCGAPLCSGYLGKRPLKEEKNDSAKKKKNGKGRGGKKRKGDGENSQKTKTKKSSSSSSSSGSRKKTKPVDKPVDKVDEELEDLHRSESEDSLNIHSPIANSLTTDDENDLLQTTAATITEEIDRSNKKRKAAPLRGSSPIMKHSRMLSGEETDSQETDDDQPDNNNNAMMELSDDMRASIANTSIDDSSVSSPNNNALITTDDQFDDNDLLLGS